MACTCWRLTWGQMRNFTAWGALALSIAYTQPSYAEDTGSFNPSLSFPSPTLQETEMERIQQIITAWLECEECTERQLFAVRSLGKAAVPTLTAILKDGPSWITLVQLYHYLKESYRKVQQHQQAAHKPPNPITEDQYVRLHLEGAVKLYQVRAAKALKAIGGPVAQQALTDALHMNLPSSVAIIVKESLKESEVPAEFSPTQ
jgi:hypothetical protein